MPEIKPALTAEEWEEFLDPKNAEWAPLMYRNWDDHCSAAVRLYGQPFGFTHEDVDYLRAVGSTDDRGHGDLRDGALLALADRIAALLPPRERGELVKELKVNPAQDRAP